MFRIATIISLLSLLLLTADAPAHLADAPVLRKHRTNVRDWTLRTTVRMRPDRERRAIPIPGDEFFIPKTGTLQFRDASFVFPVLAESATHETYLDRLESRVVIRGRRASTGTLVDVPLYPDEREVELLVGPLVLQDVLTFTLTYPMTCYEARIDEARAFPVKWPSGEWPEAARPYLEPQAWIESDHPDIATLVREWTNGRPKKAAPYFLAKYLCAKTLEHYRPTTGTYREQGVPLQGRLIGTEDRSGFILHGAAHAARAGTGSKNDLVNLLVAVYRAAGIPARPVIALDPTETELQQFPIYRVWVEFALYDEPADRLEWIPVDIIEQRSFSSRAPSIDLEWEYFGNNRTTDTRIPIASRWEPLRAGHGPHSGPAIFGWLTDPSPQVCRQELRCVGFETPMRPGLPELDKRRERSRPPAR